MNFDLLLKNGTLVFPWGEAKTDIAVRAGRIVAIGNNLGDAAEVLDLSNLHILPGIIDPHVHFRDGGQGGVPGVEDMRSGSLAAVLGGVTVAFDQPNTKPPAVDAPSIAAKHNYIPGHAFCDIGFYAGATKDNIATLDTLETMPGVCAVKVFAGSSTGNLLVEDDAHIEAVLRNGRRRVAFHSEDEFRLQERKPMFKVGDPYASHPIWRDVECAFSGTRRIVALARKTNRLAHILHVSTAEELDYLKAHKDLVGVEVLANHLLQSAPEAYERLGPYAVMNPPIREERHRLAAWAALADGTVDCLGSDHAPHSRENKEKPWPTGHSGLTGVQTLLPLMLDQVSKGNLSLLRLVDLMSAGPARIYGVVNKGRISVGYDADFSIVDLRATKRIENSWIASQCGWTPFDGTVVTGWPITTIIRGNIVVRDGAVQGEPKGQPVNFRS